MQILNSSKNRTKQIEKATVLRATIIEKMNALDPAWDGEESDDIEGFYFDLESAAPSFDIEFDSCLVGSVDRAQSMLSGPFFTTKKYPIPGDGKALAYPVVQLDLRLASNASGVNVGDGLLQVWYLMKGKVGEGIVRVIPRADVSQKLQTDFNWVPFSEKKQSQLPLPTFNWDSAAEGPAVKVVSKILPKGMMYSGCEYSIYCNAEIPKGVETQISRFVDLCEPDRTSVISLFGPFWIGEWKVEAYGKNNSGAKCLLSINDWGGYGCAEVAYQIDRKGKVKFEYREGQNR